MPISNITLFEKLESKNYLQIGVEIKEKHFGKISSRTVILKYNKIDLTSFFISAAVELGWDWDELEEIEVVTIDEKSMRREIERFQTTWEVDLEGGINVENDILYLYQLKDKTESIYNTGIYFLIETFSEFIYFDVDQFYY